METDEMSLVFPSTSTESYQTAPELNGNGESTKSTRAENDDNLTKCLEVIEKIAGMLKSESNRFVNVLDQLLRVAEEQEGRDMKLELINSIISNLCGATTDELKKIEESFKRIFNIKIDKQLVVDDDSMMHLGVLGAGAFGVVDKGLLLKPGLRPKNVAIKRSRQYRHTKLIEYEASIMSQLKHDNIIKIYAINKSATEIAMELMELGNIVSAVESFNFRKSNLMGVLKDVASGMEYLEQKQYLHRDLACRNIFLNAKKQCKIGDFAFCVYVGDKNGVYEETEHDPRCYNVAPETISTKRFTRENDVWAMGALTWELFYIAEHANELPPASVTKQFHLRRFQNVRAPLQRMKKCPHKLHSYVIERLLSLDPARRPTFSDIKKMIRDVMSSKD